MNAVFCLHLNYKGQRVGSAHTTDTGRGGATAARAGRSRFSQRGRSSARITLSLHHILHQSRIAGRASRWSLIELADRPPKGRISGCPGPAGARPRTRLLVSCYKFLFTALGPTTNNKPPEPPGSEAIKLSTLKPILPNPKKQQENNLSARVQSKSCLLCPWQIAARVRTGWSKLFIWSKPGTGLTAYEAARTRASCFFCTTHTDESANVGRTAATEQQQHHKRIKMRLDATVQLLSGSITARLRVTPAQ